MNQSPSRSLPSKEWLESWAAYFDKRAEDRGALHIGQDERRMIAQTFRDLIAAASESETQLAEVKRIADIWWKDGGEGGYSRALRDCAYAIKHALGEF